MPTPTNRRPFINVAFDRLSMDELLVRLGHVTPDTPYGYLVTPNVDHMVRLDQQRDPALDAIYRQATICVCDSRIVSGLAKLSGIDLPVAPGSELTKRLMDEIVVPGDRIAVIGGDAALVSALERLYPAISIAHHEPPMGLRTDPVARAAAAAFAANQQARFTFISVGSPQQEMIAAEIGKLPHAGGMAFCIGAALEFVVGHKQRAPRVVQRLGLEWAHRLFAEPRRMWRRYLVEGPRIFVMARRWSRQERRAR